MGVAAGGKTPVAVGRVEGMPGGLIVGNAVTVGPIVGLLVGTVGELLAGPIAVIVGGPIVGPLVVTVGGPRGGPLARPIAPVGSFFTRRLPS